MKILLEIYDILKNIIYIKRNIIAFHEYYDLYKILMKIKNIAVAFLVLLVVLTTNKNKKSFYVSNLVVVTPLEHEKSYKTPPHTNNLVVITPLEHENFWREKKIQIFLLKLLMKKFLRIQVFHTLMLYLFVR